MTATEQAPAFEGVAKPLAGIRKIAARRMVDATVAKFDAFGSAGTATAITSAGLPR